MIQEVGLVLPDRGAPGHFRLRVSAAARRAGAAAGYLLAAAATLSLLLPIAGRSLGYTTLLVAGGSMEPYASVGDVLVLRSGDASGLRPGDVVSYRPLRGAGIVTHRIVKRVDVQGMPHLQTKGDANDTPDANLVPVANVVGEVAVRVPDIGVYYHFAMSATGRILLVVVPAIFTLHGELRAVRPRRRSRSKGLRRGLCAAGIALAASVAVAAPAAGIFTEPTALGSNEFVTGQLNAPTLTSATPGSAGLLNCKVTLEWSPPATGIAPTGYEIYRATTSGGPYSLVGSVGIPTSFVNTELAKNTTYHFVLRSSRASWRSAYSNQMSARTPVPCL